MLSVSNKRCDPPTFDDPSKYQVNKKSKLLSDVNDLNATYVSKRKRDVDMISHYESHVLNSKHCITEYDQRSYLKRKSVMNNEVTKCTKLFSQDNSNTNDIHSFEWNSQYNTNQYDPIKLVYI